MQLGGLASVFPFNTIRKTCNLPNIVQGDGVRIVKILSHFIYKMVNTTIVLPTIFIKGKKMIKWLIEKVGL